MDLHTGSATYGKYYGIELTGENNKQFYIPEGFAHRFIVLSESAMFVYKVKDFYHPNDEGGLAWNDPDINVVWPLDIIGGAETALLSDKDKVNSTLKEIEVSGFIDRQKLAKERLCDTLVPHFPH